MVNLKGFVDPVSVISMPQHVLLREKVFNGLRHVYSELFLVKIWVIPRLVLVFTFSTVKSL